MSPEVEGRAWVVEAPAPIAERPLVETRLAFPEPGPHEIRLEVLACGVCHTDVHLAEGDLAWRRPTVPGHQIVGRVEMAGSGVTSRVPGDLVGVTWLAGTCGQCEYCDSGRENLCAGATFTGWDRHGGFAERVVVRNDFAFDLPGALAPRDAAPLLCAGVVGYRALRLSGIEPGQKLGLVGFGASAHLALQVARHRGCEVHVYTRGKHHRERALSLGAAWAGPLDEAAPGECHAQVLFAPSGRLVPGCLRHLRRGGTLAINAVHLSDIPELPYDALFGERVVRSVSHLTRTDAREFLQLAAAIGLETRVTAFPFDEANEALAAVKSASIDGQAVLEIGS